MAKKLTGWQKFGLFAGVGCLSIIVLIVGGVVIASMWARAELANLGDPNPKPYAQRITLPAPPTAEKPDPAASGPRAPVRLALELQEGSFTIQPGPPGTDIDLQGEFAPGLYELIQREEADAASGTRRVSVRFRSKAPGWARFFASIGGGSSTRPRLTVTLPRGTPLDLTLGLTMGESRVNLGGLTLGDVTVNAAMGEHRIDFQEPVVEGVRELRFSASMGNVSIDHLGNARADRISTSGSMGNLTVNLAGAWSPGAASDVSFEQSMGELTVRVPSNVKVDADVRGSQGEAASRTPDFPPPADPNAPTLRLRVTTSMGNSRIVRD